MIGLVANHSIFGTIAEGCSRFTTEARKHKEIRIGFDVYPDWLAAEASGKTGRSSVVAPVFTRSREDPKGSQTPGSFLCFFLGRARKKRTKPFTAKDKVNGAAREGALGHAKFRKVKTKIHHENIR